jgi:D-galactose 1-dehydrogenase
MGKIARDQHLPAIAGSEDFSLAATVDPTATGVSAVPHFSSLAALLKEGPELDAVVLCTPPQERFELAASALTHGLHVFLEKPPGVTISEVEVLRQIAIKQGVALFAGWHSRFAPGIEPARAWLAERVITRVSVIWREDVKIWHPGQEWIWQPGGLGVFDPGINALSIITHILPRPFYITQATLEFPTNREAPIAAQLSFRDTTAAEITVDLDFRQAGPQSWDIIIDTDDGQMKLTSGGAVLSLPSGVTRGEEQEYAGLYGLFANLIRRRISDVDTRPLQLVADAFLLGKHIKVMAF